MHQVTINEAQTQLPDLVNAAVGGDIVYITGGGTRLVQLVPVGSTNRPQFGSAAGLVSMSDDFDAPLEDFHEYMQ